MNDDINRDVSSQERDSSSSTNRQVVFQPQDESVPETVLTGVASLKQVDQLELPPLNEAIDPDALDALFAPRADGAERASDVTIFFTYAGYEVRIETGGAITFLAEATNSHRNGPESRAPVIITGVGPCLDAEQQHIYFTGDAASQPLSVRAYLSPEVEMIRFSRPPQGTYFYWGKFACVVHPLHEALGPPPRKSRHSKRGRWLYSL